MPDPSIDLRADHLQLVRSILEKNVPDREVWAFGSRVQGRAKPYSDLDLAVMGEQPLSLAVQAALADDFAESDLPIRVDIVDWATTKDNFRQIIARDKVVLQTPGETPHATQ